MDQSVNVKKKTCKTQKTLQETFVIEALTKFLESLMSIKRKLRTLLFPFAIQQVFI